jgi:hypothetical protein
MVWAAAALAAGLTAISLPAASVRAGTTEVAHGAAAIRLPRVRTADVAVFTALDGVFCTSAANCWAVGQLASGSALLNQVLHWNGKTWQRAPAPDPGGTRSSDVNELYAVRCLGAGDCWAAGEYLKGGAFLGQALHWNGRKWSTTAVPASGGTRSGDLTELFDSTCSSASNCWAVGDYGSGSGTSENLLNLILHWNGKKWTRTASPDPGGTKPSDESALDAVRCVSASDCNAVGAYGSFATSKENSLNETLHWNGRHWSWVRAPNPGGTGPGDVNELDGLGCGSATSCWAAGIYGTTQPLALSDTTQNEILHWNGRSWARADVPQPGSSQPGAENILVGAVCSSAANCWAVGLYRSGQAILDQALHWNGRHWASIPAANPAGDTIGDYNALFAARCVTASDCWAVGDEASESGGTGYTDQIVHWNGKKWSDWK